MYKKDILREYINNSELREFSSNIKVRLSRELVSKYDNGSYQNGLLNMQKCFDMINSLNIKYPGNAKLILYLYIIPDENYSELLRIPKHFDKGNGGGKPVMCYDLDGFNSAYGLSQNILENKPINMGISKMENTIHELAHVVHSQFFSKNQTIGEGFAETLPLYILNLEEVFLDHRNILLNLKEDQILSAQELLSSEKNGTYGQKEALPNRSCSFRCSYISSYLFIRGCIETIEEKYSFSKLEAMRYFLEIVKQSNSLDDYLIFDIANAIGINQDTLLYEKDIQYKALDSIKLLVENKARSK